MPFIIPSVTVLCREKAYLHASLRAEHCIAVMNWSLKSESARVPIKRPLSPCPDKAASRGTAMKVPLIVKRLEKEGFGSYGDLAFTR